MSVDVPEEYGGLELDKVTSGLITDKISVSGSFSVTYSAHVGIGMLPLVWYGTPAAEGEVYCQAGLRGLDRVLCAFRGFSGLTP